MNLRLGYSKKNILTQINQNQKKNANKSPLGSN